jgi:hypothetical protein
MLGLIDASRMDGLDAVMYCSVYDRIRALQTGFMFPLILRRFDARLYSCKECNPAAPALLTRGTGIEFLPWRSNFRDLRRGHARRAESQDPIQRRPSPGSPSFLPTEASERQPVRPRIAQVNQGWRRNVQWWESVLGRCSVPYMPAFLGSVQTAGLES